MGGPRIHVLGGGQVLPGRGQFLAAIRTYESEISAEHEQAVKLRLKAKLLACAHVSTLRSSSDYPTV